MAKIVLAEDEEPQRALLAAVLQEAGYEVRQAQHGRQALELIEQQRPDLVITDVMMPLLDGIELCRRLKARSDTAAIPVLMMSAAGPEVADGAGADAFLEKPFDLVELEALVRRLLAHGVEE